MRIRSANSSANHSPPLWLTWACGRSAENTTNNRNEMHPVCHTQPIISQQIMSLSCVSDRFRGPEFCLCRVKLLAAAAVTTVTRAVSGGWDEQQKHSVVGCFGGGEKEDGEIISGRHMQNNYICVSFTNIFTCLFLQHVLILAKVILSLLIPDEPDWIRKKREHIEYTSMQVLKQQVNPFLPYISLFCILVFSFICITTFSPSLPETAFWRVLIVFQSVEVVFFVILCWAATTRRYSTIHSVVWTSPAGPAMHTAGIPNTPCVYF